jgi:hypothetical protein
LGLQVQRAAAALGVAIAILTGCGADERADGTPSDLSAKLEQLERGYDEPVYWLGASFEGLPLTDTEGAQPPPMLSPSMRRSDRPFPRPSAPAPGPFLVYGECSPEGQGESYLCTGPQIQVGHWPIASPSRYPRRDSCTRTTIRGVPAAQFDHLEIYVGRTLLAISAPRAQARRAADALRRLDGSAAPPQPLPEPALDLSVALRRCALDSLDAKLDELRAHAEIPLQWGGRKVDGQPLFRAEGDGSWARFLYGSCKTPEVAGSCWPPVTIEVTPNAESHPARWHPSARCTRLEIRGAPAAAMPSASALFVFTGEVTVHLHGPDAALVRRAAEALHSLDGLATGDHPPPPDELVAALRTRCSP